MAFGIKDVNLLYLPEVSYSAVCIFLRMCRFTIIFISAQPEFRTMPPVVLYGYWWKAV